MRELKLTLLGEPIAKQSVRQGKSGTGSTTFYQPDKYKVFEMQYLIQIKRQIPKDFVMFTKWVRLEKCIFVHETTKQQLKSKKTLEFLQGGGLIRKTTRPDLKDNLYKFPLDVLTGWVYKDDGLICEGGSDGKYYGLVPRIELHFMGE